MKKTLTKDELSYLQAAIAPAVKVLDTPAVIIYGKLETMLEKAGRRRRRAKQEDDSIVV